MLNNYHTGHDQSNCSGVEYFFLLINGQKTGFIKDLRRYIEGRYKIQEKRREEGAQPQLCCHMNSCKAKLLVGNRYLRDLL